MRNVYEKNGLLVLFGVAVLSLSGCEMIPNKTPTEEEPTTENDPSSEIDSSGETEPPVHSHTFSEDWSHDSEHHWHASTCGHDVIDGESDHTFGNWVIDIQPTEEESGSKHKTCSVCGYSLVETIEKLTHVHTPGTPVVENRVEADCENDGSYELVTYCSACSEELSRTLEVITKLGHDYGTPSYTWSNDYLKCTAKRICSRDTTHIEEETVDSDASYIIEPYYDSLGRGSFVATFSNPAFETQETGVVNVPVKEHTYSEEWSTDKNEHWHACLDEGFKNLKSDRGNHQLVDAGVNPRFSFITRQQCEICSYIIESFNIDSSYVHLNCNVVNHSYVRVSPNIKEGFDGTLVIPSTYNGYPVMFAGGFQGYGSIKTLIIKGDDLLLSEAAFKNCTGLETVILGSGFDGCETFDAFEGCSSLKEFYVLENSNNIFTSEDGILYGYNSSTKTQYVSAVPGGLKDVSFKSGITSVPEKICYENHVIESVVFPDSVTTIGDFAFKRCDKLKSITLGAGVTNIKTEAFVGCTSLTTIFNHSKLKLTPGSEDYGYIARYATEIITD